MNAARDDARWRADQSVTAIVIIGGLLSIWIVPFIALVLVGRLETYGLIPGRWPGLDSIIWGSRWATWIVTIGVALWVRRVGRSEA